MHCANSGVHRPGILVFWSGSSMKKDLNFPFDLDLSSLDTGSITNILNDIELHLPLMESEGDLNQLLQVKAFFEDELKVTHRLH